MSQDYLTGATFVPDGDDSYYMPEVVSPAPQRYCSPCQSFAASSSNWIPGYSLNFQQISRTTWRSLNSKRRKELLPIGPHPSTSPFRFYHTRLVNRALKLNKVARIGIAKVVLNIPNNIKQKVDMEALLPHLFSTNQI